MRLALDAGTTVSADRLLDDLWAGAATRATRCRPRSRGCGARSGPAVIDGALPARRAPRRRSTPCACCATPPPRRRLDAGDEHGARELSAAALDRFRGELLPAAGDWAAPHRSQLEEARAKLLETQLAARLRLGEAVDRRARGRRGERALPRGAVGAADHRALPRRPPGRRARGLPARPRAAGRRPRARARARGCKELERQVLQHDPALRAAPAGNLPSLQAELVGRDDEVAALAELLADAAARRGRRPGRRRQDGGRDRDRARAAGHRLARPARGRHDRRRRPRHGDRRAQRDAAARRRCSSGCAPPARCSSSTTASTCSTRRPRWRSACSTRRPELRILATSQVALDVEGEARATSSRRSALDDAVELFTRRAARARRRPDRAVPRARRPAARDRARRRPHAGRSRSRRSPAGSTTASAC